MGGYKLLKADLNGQMDHIKLVRLDWLGLLVRLALPARHRPFPALLALPARLVQRVAPGLLARLAPLVRPARAALSGHIGYTESLGIWPLRQRIARHYHEFYGVEISPERVIVTTGSSAGFILAFLSMFEAGDRVGLLGTGEFTDLAELLQFGQVLVVGGARGGAHGHGAASRSARCRAPSAQQK